MLFFNWPKMLLLYLIYFFINLIEKFSKFLKSFFEKLFLV